VTASCLGLTERVWQTIFSNSFKKADGTLNKHIYPMLVFGYKLSQHSLLVIPEV
jgi:hypothetical protein